MLEDPEPVERNDVLEAVKTVIAEEAEQIHVREMEALTDKWEDG